MTYYAIFLTALFGSMVLVAVLMRFATRLNLIDVPDHRKVHAAAIPRVGGVGMVAGSVLAIVAWGGFDGDLRGFMAAVAVIVLFGIWDDRHDLAYQMKLLGQLLAVLLVVLPGSVLIERLSFMGSDSLPLMVSIPLTVVFLLGTTNATNLADGLDGLASGFSLLSLACLLLLAELADAHRLALVALAICGGIMGFLRYNTHPALVFMGDTGSQFLGFSLGVLSVWLTQRENTALEPELLLLILGLPIIDTLTVMTQRLWMGQSPFKADRNHFHHKLLSLGFDHYEAVIAAYAVQTVFVVSAYLLRYERASTLFTYYLVLAAMVVLFHPLAQWSGWRLHVLRPGQVSRLTGTILSLRKAARWEEAVHYLVAILIAGFLIVGSFVPCALAVDIGRFAWVMVPAALSCWMFKSPLSYVIERLIIYTLAIFAGYTVDYELARSLSPHHAHLQYFFLALGILLALGMHLSRGAYFRVTPSDFLVMGVLLVAAYLPALNESGYTKLALESVVLLYGIEFLLRRHGHPSVLLRAGTLFGLGAVALRSSW